jgi:hypothetical protein
VENLATPHTTILGRVIGFMRSRTAKMSKFPFR